MQVTEMYYENIDFRQFPFGLADWTNEVSLKADKGRTPEQREQFKQQVIKEVETDRLMMAQEVSLFIIGVAANYLTPWGGPPITGRAFEEDAIDALIAAGNGDPFVIHALAYETSKRVLRQALQNPEAMLLSSPGEQQRRISKASVEAVVADKESVVQAALNEYAGRTGLPWKLGSSQKGQRRRPRHRKARRKEN
jgi:hypothetical protein